MAGRPTVLFTFDETHLLMAASPVRSFDVAPDGQRFYAVERVTPAPTAAATRINVIQNWLEELKAKVPVR